MTEYLSTRLEIKAVDRDKRTIAGWAAVHSNLDRVNDIIDPTAFTKTLTEKKPSDVGVYIGHDYATLPMGIPLVMQVDDKGLYTETLIKPTAAGDELLGTAQFLHDHGQSLGMSIGYQTRDSKREQHQGKSVRRLLDIDLIEYSYAGSQSIANPEALVSAVKTAIKSEMDAAARNSLDSSEFAYVDSEGGKHLPINDAAHVRAAMARFNQTQFDSSSAKAKAWKKILAAAKREGVDVEDESMPKAAMADPVETKADPSDPALKKVVKAHQDALEAHANAVSELHKYHGGRMASLAEGSPAEEASESASEAAREGDAAKMIAELIAAFEQKAGAMMNQEHLGQLHGAMAALGSLHNANCKNTDCPHRMGSGTDEGVGDSKTGGNLPVDDMLASYRARFAALSA